MTVRVVVPNKGRLAAGAFDLLRRAGLETMDEGSRALCMPAANDSVEVVRASAWDIPRWIADGAAQIGITGLDVVEEAARETEIRLRFDFGACRLSLAAPEESGVRSVADVPRDAVIGTSYPRLVRAFFDRRGSAVRVVEVRGAAEVVPSIGAGSLVADIVETGASLRSNGLREIAVLLRSQAVAIVGPAGRGPSDRREVDRFLDVLEAIARAGRRRFLIASGPHSAADEIRAAIDRPPESTLLGLSSAGSRSVFQATVDLAHVDRLVASIRRRGATEILVVPIDRLVI